MSRAAPDRAVFLRKTEGRSDKVYHIYYYPDKVVVEYGRHGSTLREIVYPGEKGQRKEQEKRNSGYEDYQPHPPVRFRTASQPAKPSKPANKAASPGLSGKLAEAEPAEGEHPMARYLF